VVDSTNLEAGLGLARSQMANGNAEEALKQIVQLSRLHPDSPEVFELLAQTYKTLGKTQEAQQAEYRARRLRGRRLKQLLTD